MNRKHLILLALSLWAASAAQAACPSTASASRFAFNTAGDEVTDNKTGLVWARCSVGQAWSGSACTGSASAHTHEQALQLAQAATGWRLPNVKELSSIADKGCQSPAIDSTAFPNTPNAGYWSSSPYVGDASVAWYVLFDGGDVDGDLRGNTGAVRLVRASQ
jgi:Protein of unknown function (DUF1566)